MWSVRPFKPFRCAVVVRADGVTDRLFGREAWVIRLPDERVCRRLSAAVERTDGVTDRRVSGLLARTDGATERTARLEVTGGRNGGPDRNEDIRAAPLKRAPPPKPAPPPKCAPPPPPKCPPPPPPPPRAHATSLWMIDVIPTKVNSVNFFISQDRCLPLRGHCASAGFCGATEVLMATPSFGIEPGRPAGGVSSV